MSDANIFNSVEEELWRIFTFYALHTDPTSPDVWKPANFIKFSKDCQITSKKLSPTAVELEITRLSRLKSEGTDYNPSITITFTDFMDLLDALSLKVYPRDPPQIAAKRLILENVLLLANRRIPTNDYFDLDNPDANKVVNETFVKSLQGIFNHYLDQADKRRNQLVAAEKMRAKDLTLQTNKDITALSVTRSQDLQRLKEYVRSQRDLINYREYIQFCHDFSLKSTSLLTAIQVGEIFLNIVPFDFETGAQQGMTFELFCKTIVYMAAVAYRDCSPEVELQNKVRAFLLYMWKAVNDSDKTMRLIGSTRISAITSSAGSLNLFGSGLFSEQFLAHWMKDGFPDYSLPPERNDSEEGAALLKKIVGDTTDGVAVGAAGDGSGPETDDTDSTTGGGGGGGGGGVSNESKRSNSKTHNRNHNNGKARSVTAGSSPSRGGKNRTMATKMLDFSLPPTPLDNINSSGYGSKDGQSSLNQLTKAVSNAGQTLNLQGSHLNQLFRLKPELTEFLYLEIQNMKLEDAINGTE